MRRRTMKKMLAGFVVGLACGAGVPFMPQARYSYATHPMQHMTVEVKRDRLTGRQWERVVGFGDFKPVKTSRVDPERIIDPVAVLLWPQAILDD